MKKEWIYYGVFFSEIIKSALIDKAKKLVEIPKDWSLYADHMTILFNDGDESKQEKANELELMIGERQQLIINSIGVSSEAIAFGVSNYATQNEHSHITIATAPGIKPVRSNFIEKWTQIKPFNVTGIIKKVK